MAGEWIKFRTSLIKDGRVRISAKAMGLKSNAGSVTVIGALVTLWCLADQQADEDGVLYGYEVEDIDELVGINSFCESLHSDWIDITGEWVKLPDFQEHNGQSAKKRAQTARRAAKHRKNVKSVTGVTQEALSSALPREEKNRKENIDIHTQEHDTGEFENLMSQGWQPSETVLTQLKLAGIPKDFALQQLTEFIGYWCVRGGTHNWDSKFYSRIQDQWVRRNKRGASKSLSAVEQVSIATGQPMFDIDEYTTFGAVDAISERGG